MNGNYKRFFIEHDYYPFGMLMPGRNFSSENYQFGFNGKEINGEVNGAGNSLDFGARIYDPRIGRWLSNDPLQKEYPSNSPYNFVRGNPILKVDIGGLWDIEVHVHNKRSRYGYGIAIVKDRNGNEVFRFKVRAEGTAGHNRRNQDADTPLGVYDIPDTDMWKAAPTSVDDRISYGPNPRLILNEESGEILQTGRSLIRIHGGRQESYNPQTGRWTRDTNADLKKTHGCLRAYDDDVARLKQVTDNLTAADPLEVGGKLKVKDDLIKRGNRYFTPDDDKKVAAEVGSMAVAKIIDIYGSSASRQEATKQLDDLTYDMECETERIYNNSTLGQK